MIADIAVGIFLLAGILAGIRLVRGPSLADRVISRGSRPIARQASSTTVETRVTSSGRAETRLYSSA